MANYLLLANKSKCKFYFLIFFCFYKDKKKEKFISLMQDRNEELRELLILMIFAIRSRLMILANIWMSQKFCNILVLVSLRCVFHVIEAVQAVGGTCCGW